MQINENTKISELIRENAASIQAIASINRHFEKLKNPLLRKILASRVTIGDAARIGKCSVQDFFDKLQPLGFEVGPGNEQSRANEVKPAEGAFVPEADPAMVERLDVRPLIKSNKDPFQEIMQALKQLPAGKVLLLINSFEPTPLVRLLEPKGYQFQIKHVSADLVETWIRPAGNRTDVHVERAGDQEAFDHKKEAFGHNLRNIDVRSMEMPGPMLAILKELEELQTGQALFVRHKRIPQFLLPELRQRNFSWLIKEVSAQEVHLLIYK